VNSASDFDTKLKEFLENLPKSKEDIKKNYSLWYRTLKTEMKQNDSNISKNTTVNMNRKDFMIAHLEQVKPVFENLFQEHIKKIIIDIVPSIIFPNNVVDLSSFVLCKIKSNYKFGSYIGIWTKSGVYGDIIVKIFKRMIENKTELMLKCKLFFETIFNMKLAQIDYSNKTSDIVKSLLKIIDHQILSQRELKTSSAKAAFLEYFQSVKENQFINKLKKLVESV